MVKTVLAYVAARWAEGSTRRNLVIFIVSGSALVGANLTEVTVERWMGWINAVVMLAGLLGMTTPDRTKEEKDVVVSPQPVESVVPPPAVGQSGAARTERLSVAVSPRPVVSPPVRPVVSKPVSESIPVDVAGWGDR